MGVPIFPKNNEEKRGEDYDSSKNSKPEMGGAK